MYAIQLLLIIINNDYNTISRPASFHQSNRKHYINHLLILMIKKKESFYLCFLVITILYIYIINNIIY